MKVAELKEGLLQLSLDTSGLKAELVRQLTEARTAREGAEQEPQYRSFNGFFSLAYGWGVAKRCLINAINPTTHKHAVPALVGLFLGWVRAWDPTWAHCRCEMCDGGEFRPIFGAKTRQK